jgi:predicted transcriptional regulator
LSALEHEVMTIVWRRRTATADDVVAALSKPLTNATVRTLLRRLEAKGYVRHTVRGRAFVYRPRVAQAEAASGAVRRVMQRFFDGSASKLLLGLVDEGLIAREEVAALSRRLRRARKRGADD